MAQNVLELILKATDDASKVVEGFGDTFEKHRKQIGIGMTAVGGIISGVSALAIKSSQEQAIGIRTLDQALQRVNTSYEAQKTSIETAISAMQAKTNFSDEQQREALRSLVTLTGNYENSLAALPAVLNVAASLNMDLNSASLLVGKALAGNTSALSRYGITLEEGADATAIIAALTGQFGGSAEAAADPMVQLKNTIDDLMQVLGDVLLPILNDGIKILAQVAQRVQAFAEAHPQLTKVILIAVAALGGLMLVLGPILLMLPGIIAAVGMFGAVMTIAMGPVGLIALAIVGLVTAGILLWKNWDTIKEKALALWEGITGIFKLGVNSNIQMLNGLVGAFEAGFNALIGIVNAFKIGFPGLAIAGKQIIPAFSWQLPPIPTLALPRIPLLDTGGIVQGPGVFAVGPGVREIVREPGQGNLTVNIQGPIFGMDDLERKIGEAIIRLRRRGFVALGEV